MPEVLLQICHVWEQNSREPDNIMLWAACTTYFFGLLRSGEIPVPLWQEFDPGAHLRPSDVTLDSWSPPKIAQLNIKSLKDRCISAQGVNLLGKDWQSICAQWQCWQQLAT